jgi:hypothetical protein
MRASHLARTLLVNYLQYLRMKSRTTNQDPSAIHAAGILVSSDTIRPKGYAYHRDSGRPLRALLLQEASTLKHK